MKNQTVDPREVFLQKNAVKNVILPPQAIEDLRYFEKRAADGLRLGREGLERYMLQEHGIKVGRFAIYNAAVKAGIKPWWNK